MRPDLNIAATFHFQFLLFGLLQKNKLLMDRGYG